MLKILGSSCKGKGEELRIIVDKKCLLTYTGRRCIRYRGKKRIVKIRRRYFFGLRRKRPIRRFRRRLRIRIGGRYKKIKRWGRRWRVRIRRKWCRLRRRGRSWSYRRRRTWKRIKRVRLVLKLRKRLLRVRRRKKMWYLRKGKRWRRVRRRIRCSIRFRGKRIKVKLIGRRGAKIFRKGRYGKARRILWRRELIMMI